MPPWLRLRIINQFLPLTFYWPRQYILAQYQWGRKFISPLVELQKTSTGRHKELGTKLNLPQLASTKINVSYSSDGIKFFRKGGLVQLQSLPLSLRTTCFWIFFCLSGHFFSVLFSGSASLSSHSMIKKVTLFLFYHHILSLQDI